MKKLNTAPISGMQELLPAKQKLFDEIKSQIAEVYRVHGFHSIETPIIDRTEILFAKAGGDTEKQIYKVVKTAETEGDADQALRFDHTVPLARYVVEHESDLTFPFKATQIGRNFRGERPQKGRYRELYQCDVDVIGRNNLPIAYDAEIIATLSDALKSFVEPKILLRVSNRKLLTGLLESQNLQEKSKDIFSIIDHAEKVAPEKTQTYLDEISLTSAQKDLINSFMQIRGERKTAIKSLKSLNINNETYTEGVDELDHVLGLLTDASRRDDIIADMLIVRGLDYYTGTVFEVVVPEHKEIGSICGGGRYENLAENYTDQKFPGVGGSIGLTRLFYVLSENNLLKNTTSDTKSIDIVIVPISINEQPYAFELAEKLRKKGHSVDVNLTDKRLGDKLSYAAKLARQGIVIGENETRTGNLKLKDFATGKETPLDAAQPFGTENSPSDKHPLGEE